MAVVSILVVAVAVAWVSCPGHSMAFGGMGGLAGSRTGGSYGGMGMGSSRYLPPGYSMIDGELVEMSNKVIQRVGGGAGGTQYYSWTDQRGPPVFRRREIDTGRRFIVFPDRNYPPGDGHYVVLRKFTHGKGQRRGGNIYEAFYLDLGDSINAMVTNFNSLSPASVGGMMGGRRGMAMGGGDGYRMKRKTEVDTAMVYLIPPEFWQFQSKNFQDNNEDEEEFDNSEAEIEFEVKEILEPSKSISTINIA